MHHWTVGGAVIESDVIAPEALPEGLSPVQGVLLVENRRNGGFVDWTPPGGVIDRGESVLEGLTREVQEETGLQVLTWSEPIYEIDALAPELGWRLRVVVHRAEVVVGSLRIGADPDGIVSSADVVPPEQCARRLDAAHPWVREPLLDWMELRWSTLRRYCYLAEGTDHRHLRISRRHEDEDHTGGGDG